MYFVYYVKKVEFFSDTQYNIIYIYMSFTVAQIYFEIVLIPRYRLTLYTFMILYNRHKPESAFWLSGGMIFFII